MPTLRLLPAQTQQVHGPHGANDTQRGIKASGFERGCLSRPVGDAATPGASGGTPEAERNTGQGSMHCQLTSQHARTKLAQLYPVKQTQLD